MTRLLQVFFFFTIFGSTSYYAQRQPKTAMFGDPCERDIDCIDNAFCRGQHVCQCELLYSPSPDRSICIATAGLSCSNDSTCATMSNAECRQNVCTCKESFMLDMHNSSNCIKRPTRVGELCQKRDDCEDTLERAMCINETCRCFSGFQFVNETGKCIKIRTLYTKCKKDYECFLDDGTPNVLQCKNNECVCSEGDSRCNKGSFGTTTMKLAIYSILLLRLL